MNAVSAILLLAAGFLAGVTVLLSYFVTRCLSSPGWDTSNMTNALRLLAHVVLHPEDFVHMWYVKWANGIGFDARRAFPYLGQDELSEVVKTRPTKAERDLE